MLAYVFFAILYKIQPYTEIIIHIKLNNALDIIPLSNISSFVMLFKSYTFFGRGYPIINVGKSIIPFIINKLNIILKFERYNAIGNNGIVNK